MCIYIYVYKVIYSVCNYTYIYGTIYSSLKIRKLKKKKHKSVFSIWQEPKILFFQNGERSVVL